MVHKMLIIIIAIFAVSNSNAVFDVEKNIVKTIEQNKKIAEIKLETQRIKEEANLNKARADFQKALDECLSLGGCSNDTISYPKKVATTTAKSTKEAVVIEEINNKNKIIKNKKMPQLPKLKAIVDEKVYFQNQTAFHKIGDKVNDFWLIKAVYIDSVVIETTAEFNNKQITISLFNNYLKGKDDKKDSKSKKSSNLEKNPSYFINP